MQYRGHRIEYGVVAGDLSAWSVYDGSRRVAIAESKAEAKILVDVRVDRQPRAKIRKRVATTDRKPSRYMRRKIRQIKEGWNAS